MKENEISERVIGCAIELHQPFGPGLLESVSIDSAVLCASATSALQPLSASVSRLCFSDYIVSFRQACMNDFGGTATVVVFQIWEDHDGWTKTPGDSRVSGARARSV